MIKSFFFLPVITVGLLLASPTVANPPAASIFEQQNNPNAGKKIRKDVEGIYAAVTDHYRRLNIEREPERGHSGGISYFVVGRIKLLSLTPDKAEVEVYQVPNSYVFSDYGGLGRARYRFLGIRGEKGYSRTLSLLKINDVWFLKDR